MFSRKIQFVALLVLVAFSSCESEKTEQLTGELYFPWLKMGNYYGQPDSVYQYYQTMRDSITLEELRKDDPSGAEYMIMLEENDLLLAPYVYLHIGGDQNALLFMDSSQYELFKTFDYSRLREQEQKITVKATVKKLKPLMYHLRKLHRTDRVSGETLPEETKYRIENYK